ncbi:hypothetical protein THASP1DRAFT_24743 [Thamnocephalis sphaerospora]|uniref:Uncharacterized protein n=1 Tax=Thamnocephalis sphaerospora TaxID=78915 RepID=A0A4P9XP50_9FUNG|nr:hypothetical protein THASP1DRAFT_24743 [Thamnocephalis sphaerospora]|eukprot:RKP07030.1 hypothetical protein THASP1DRAFT_24743 [Thamnocephalis sphaerospora]
MDTGNSRQAAATDGLSSSDQQVAAAMSGDAVHSGAPAIPRPMAGPPAGYAMPAHMPHPSGWSEHRGPTGQPYYYNAFTRQSTWKRPSELDQPMLMRMAEPPAAYGAPGSVPAMAAPSIVMAGPPLQLAGGVPTEQPALKPKKKDDKAKKMRPIPGTKWKLVSTSEGREFYFDTETKKSVWVIPEEIADALEAMKQQDREETKRKAEQEAEREAEDAKRQKPEEEEGTEMTEDDILFQLQMMQQEARSLEDVEEEARRTADQGQEGNALDADEEANLSPAKREEKFRDLLRDIGVSAFSFWEKELPKMAADPRFLLIDALKTRKEIFDKYCKELVEGKQQKAPATTATKRLIATHDSEQTPEEKYNGLLEKEVTRHTRWEDFRHKFKRDSRFLGVNIKDRERLFNEHLSKLQKSQKGRSSRENARENFLQLLRETRRIDAETSWRTAKRWIDDDDRYDAVRSADDREDLFYEYRRELEKSDRERKARREREEKEREKRRREEASLREREYQVRRERTQRDREARSQRALVDKEDATRVFQTLLIDRIHKHTTTWSEAQPELHRDNRFDRCMEVLGGEELERLYHEHIDTIYRARLQAFHALLEKRVPLSVGEWADARDIVADSQELRQMRMADEELGRLYERYYATRVTRARHELDQLLRESQFIEFHARDGTLDVKSVFDVFQEDQRYLQLEFMAADRDKTVEEYVKAQIELSNRAKKTEDSDEDDDRDDKDDTDM